MKSCISLDKISIKIYNIYRVKEMEVIKMNKEDIKWLIQMLLIIAVPIIIEYIKQKELFKRQDQRK